MVRTTIYGHTAQLLGYKLKLAVAMEPIGAPGGFLTSLEDLFSTPVLSLSSFYEAALTNTNSILHTMWVNREGEMYDHHLLFDKEWTNDASRMIKDIDKEFMQLLKVLHVNPYYE